MIRKFHHMNWLYIDDWYESCWNDKYGPWVVGYKFKGDHKEWQSKAPYDFQALADFQDIFNKDVEIKYVIRRCQHEYKKDGETKLTEWECPPLKLEKVFGRRYLKDLARRMYVYEEGSHG